MKILVGYDGTNASKEALNLAKMHAKSFGAAVDIVTSMEKGTEMNVRISNRPSAVWSGQNPYLTKMKLFATPIC